MSISLGNGRVIGGSEGTPSTNKREVEGLLTPTLIKTNTAQTEKNSSGIGEYLKNAAKNITKSSAYFDNGYDVGDISRTARATTKQLGAKVLQGFTDITESVSDWTQYRVADVLDLFGKFDAADKWREDAQMNSFAQLGDLIRTGSTAPSKNDTIYTKEWYEQAQQGGIAGTTSEFAAQGVGTVLGMLGLSAIESELIGAIGGEAATVPLGKLNPQSKWLVKSGEFTSLGSKSVADIGGTFLTSYMGAAGSAETEALKEGYGTVDAKRAGRIAGMSEAISEMFFDGMGGLQSAAIGETLLQKALPTAVTQAVDKFFSTKTGKIVHKILDASEEGSEEILSNVFNAIGNDIQHLFSPGYQANGMSEQTGNIFADAWAQLTSEESWLSFIAAGLTSAILSSTDVSMNDEYGKSLVEAFAEDNNMTVDQAKVVLDSVMTNANVDEQTIEQTLYYTVDSNIDLKEISNITDIQQLTELKNSITSQMESFINTNLSQQENVQKLTDLAAKQKAVTDRLTELEEKYNASQEQLDKIAKEKPLDEQVDELRNAEAQEDKVEQTKPDTLEAATVKDTADTLRSVIDDKAAIKTATNRKDVRKNYNIVEQFAVDYINVLNEERTANGQPKIVIIRQAELNKAQLMMQDALASFGRQVIFAKNLPSSFVQAKSDNPNASKVLYINDKVTTGLLAKSSVKSQSQAMTYAVGHELFHSLKMEKPDVYNEFVDYVAKTITDDQIIKFMDMYDQEHADKLLKNLQINGQFNIEAVLKNPKKYKKQYSALFDIAEEMTANEFGGMLTDVEYMTNLKTKNKNLFQKIVSAIKQFFKDIDKPIYNSTLTQFQISTIRQNFEDIVSGKFEGFQENTETNAQTSKSTTQQEKTAKSTTTKNTKTEVSFEKVSRAYNKANAEGTLEDAKRAQELYDDYVARGGKEDSTTKAAIDNLVDILSSEAAGQAKPENNGVTENSTTEQKSRRGKPKKTTYDKAIQTFNELANRENTYLAFEDAIEEWDSTDEEIENLRQFAIENSDSESDIAQLKAWTPETYASEQAVVEEYTTKSKEENLEEETPKKAVKKEKLPKKVETITKATETTTPTTGNKETVTTTTLDLDTWFDNIQNRYNAATKLPEGKERTAKLDGVATAYNNYKAKGGANIIEELENIEAPVQEEIATDNQEEIARKQAFKDTMESLSKSKSKDTIKFLPNKEQSAENINEKELFKTKKSMAGNTEINSEQRKIRKGAKQDAKKVESVVSYEELQTEYEVQGNEDVLQTAIADIDNEGGYEAAAQNLINNKDAQWGAYEIAKAEIAIAAAVKSSNAKIVTDLMNVMLAKKTAAAQQAQMVGWMQRKISPEYITQTLVEKHNRAATEILNSKSKEAINNVAELVAKETGDSIDEIKKTLSYGKGINKKTVEEAFKYSKYNLVAKEVMKLTDTDLNIINTFVTSAQNKLNNKEIPIDKRSREAAEAYAAINQYLESKIPKKLGEKISAWRYAAMLSSPLSFQTNFNGNIVSTFLSIPMNFVASKLDALISKKYSQERSVNTSGLPSAKGVKKRISDEVNQILSDAKAGRLTATKYTLEESGGKVAPFNANTKLGAMANAFIQYSAAGMEVSDAMAWAYHFETEYQNLASIKGVEKLSDEDITRCTDYADRMTFKNSDGWLYKQINSLTNWMNRWTKAPAFKGTAIEQVNLGSIAQPFFKAATNIITMAEEFSPAGFINTANARAQYQEALATKDSTQIAMAQQKYARSAAKAIVGSVLYAILKGLSEAGVISEPEDADDDKEMLQKAIGFQGKAIKFTFGDRVFYFKVDSPLISTPLTIATEGLSASGILENVSDELNLSLVNSVLELIQYGDKGFMNELKYIATSLPASYVPNALRDIADIIDNDATYTYQNTDNTFGDLIYNTVAPVVDKVPLAKGLLPKKTDSLGNEMKVNTIPNVVLKGLGTVTSSRIDPITNELQDIYDNTNSKAGYPHKVPTYIEVDGERVYLSNKQKSALQKEMGKKYYDYASIVINSAAYQNADWSTKATALQRVSDYVLHSAEVAANIDEDYTPKNTVYKEINKLMTEYGLSEYDAVLYYSTIASIPADLDANNNEIPGTKLGKKAYAIIHMPTSDDVKNIYLARIQPTSNYPQTVAKLSGLYSEQDYINYYKIENDHDYVSSQSISKEDYRVGAKYFNISSDSLTQYLLDLSEIKSDYDSNGNTITNSKKQKIINYINSLDLSITQKEFLFGAAGYSVKGYKQDLMSYINSLNASQEEKAAIYDYFFS